MATSDRRHRTVSSWLILAACALGIAVALLTPGAARPATSTGAVISNGTVALGVNAIGDLNYFCDSSADTNCPAATADTTVGIRYLPLDTDGISPGCPCEGWGAADLGTGLTGDANESFGGASPTLTVSSFTATTTTAVSAVDIADPAIPGASMHVVQDYHPSAASPNLYEVSVAITNTGTVPFTNLVYRRVMDWDIEPTAFSEWVTIQNPGNSPQLKFDSDDGFASADPLQGPSYIDSTAVCGPGYTGICTFTNLGFQGTYPTVTSPDDHGSLFDFAFGAVNPGTTVNFKIYYGAADSRANALGALTSAGAEVYSLGEPDCPESGGTPGCADLPPASGVTQGLPNTFAFGFVTTAADLRITKSDSPDPVTVGKNLTYTLTIQNAGPNAAAAVEVEDLLPANVTFVSATPSKGTCTGTTTITCELGTVANNATETVTIVVTPTAVGPLSNTATVSSPSADANPANNTSTAATTVNPLQADLSVVKTDAPDPVTVGGDITYTLAVHNAGPDAAAAVTVTDVLPAGVAFKSASAGCVNAAGTVTCSLGSLASGADATATITVTTTQAGEITNTATAASTTADPASGNNSSSATTTVNPASLSADLSITKTDAPDPVTVGGDITYTLAVHNAGPDAAAAVTVTDVLPAGVAFKSASAGCVNAAGTVTCSLGSLASGADATATITVTTTQAGEITNTATAASTTADPASGNNSSSATTTVMPALLSADLSITKTDTPDPVIAGGDITYTLAVHNNGPDAAAAVTVTDVLPAGVAFKSASAGCVNAAGTVTCSLGSLASGADATATITVTTTQAGEITNTATAASTTADPASGNNSSSATTTVMPALLSADLSITKTDTPDPVIAGGDITYTLAVHNNGPDAAAAVTVTDVLPAGVAFKSASAGCVNAAGTVTCNLGSLASGADATATITVTTTQARTVINSVTVTSSTPDPASGNNTTDAITTVTPANQPPVCANVTADPSELWPPNHKLVLVRLRGATDADGDTVAITVTTITQDEPVDVGPDALMGSASNQVWLRAERDGSGDGRVYRIGFTASDGKGGTCTGVAFVRVPHDRGKGIAVDSGLSYDSLTGVKLP